MSLLLRQHSRSLNATEGNFIFCSAGKPGYVNWISVALGIMKYTTLLEKKTGETRSLCVSLPMGTDLFFRWLVRPLVQLVLRVFCAIRDQQATPSGVSSASTCHRFYGQGLAAWPRRRGAHISRLQDAPGNIVCTLVQQGKARTFWVLGCGCLL